MLYTSLTPKFFGVNLFGDYNDLDKLYNVIHHCAVGFAEDSSAQRHLHYVAYEVRHALQGQGKKHLWKSNEGEQNTYYGSTFPLPYYLLFVNLMQNAFTQERRLYQTATILNLVSDLQETAMNSGCLQFTNSVDYWAFNSLLNQPRLIPGSNITSAIRDKDYLTVTADYAVWKFIKVAPKNRLAKLGQVMDFMHAYSDEHKRALEDLRSLGIFPKEGAHLEFEMLEPKQW